jgi:hypothetical protein
MNSVARLVLAFCIFAGASFAQNLRGVANPPSKSEIENLLSSGEPRSVAWGAHYAAATKNQAVVPSLVSLARAWQATAGAAPDSDNPGSLTSDETDRRDAMAAVLDALIQMHAVVPVGILRNLAADFANYVAILLSRLPLEQSQSLSWEFYRSEPKTLTEHNLQYVSAALLAEGVPAGFAADLFSRIHVRAKIFITRPGVAAGAEALRGGGFGCFADEPRQDWPSFGVYNVPENKIAGSFVIVSDAHPVYVARSETTHYRGDRCEGFGGVALLGPEERQRFLAQMLKIPTDDLGWAIESRDRIEFRSEQQFYRDLMRFIAAQQDDYRVTAEALVAKNLMTVSEEEQSLPQIDLYFVDQRGHDYSPIAEPASLPGHVTWHESIE